VDIKTLNTLAKACRKLGISHLKTPELEITLSSDILSPRASARGERRKSAPANEAIFDEAVSDKISDTDLLFWSSAQ